MVAYLLDTSVIIDYLRGKQETVNFVRDVFQGGAVLGCCAVNIAEVYAGMIEKERNATEKFLESLEYYPIERGVAKKAGEYKKEYRDKGTTLATTDVLIAAVALAYELILVTGNTKDYPMAELKMVAHKAP
ncbi:MAG TPA: type II toxin-antitoxin system VapC family toxin [Candidatus Paceibacterota bacterium]